MTHPSPNFSLTLQLRWTPSRRRDFFEGSSPLNSSYSLSHITRPQHDLRPLHSGAGLFRFSMMRSFIYLWRNIYYINDSFPF